jgi:hypothetical protein
MSKARMIGSKEDFQRAVAKLTPKNGDIIFVDVSAFNLEDLLAVPSPSPDQDDVVFVAVRPKPGQSVADTVSLLTRAEIVELLKAVQ